MYTGHPLSGKGKVHGVRTELGFERDGEQIVGMSICNKKIAVVEEPFPFDEHERVCRKCSGVHRDERLSQIREAVAA